MSRSNRLAFLTLGFTGTLAIIGAGFSAWVFVGEDTTVSSKINAGVSVTQHLEVGRIVLSLEKEALRDLKYDTTTQDPNTIKIGEHEYNKAQLISLYNTRKIVFSDGESQLDSNGLDFYRYQYDNSLGVRTFIRDETVTGNFVINKNNTNIPNGYTFKNGIRTTISPNSTSPINLSTYVKLNDKYNPDSESCKQSFNYLGQNFLSVNPIDPSVSNLFSWRELSLEEVHQDEFLEIDEVNETAFYFKANLSEMFSYYDTVTAQDVRDIEKYISSSTDINDWSISFTIVSAIVEESKGA